MVRIPAVTIMGTPPHAPDPPNDDEKTEEHYENVPPPPFIQIASSNSYLWGLDAQGRVWEMEWYNEEDDDEGRGTMGHPSHWERIDVPARVKARLG